MLVKILEAHDPDGLETLVNAWLCNDEPGTIESMNFSIEQGTKPRYVVFIVWHPEIEEDSE